MRNTFWFIGLSLSILTGTSFMNKRIPAASAEGEYIYILAYPGTQNNSKNYYLSGVIRYNGYADCEDYTTKHDLFSEAGHKFLNHLENEYSLEKKNWKLQYVGKGSPVDYPSGYFEGFETPGEAEKVRKAFVREKTDDGIHKVFESQFIYSCE